MQATNENFEWEGTWDEKDRDVFVKNKRYKRVLRKEGLQ